MCSKLYACSWMQLDGYMLLYKYGLVYILCDLIYLCFCTDTLFHIIHLFSKTKLLFTKYPIHQLTYLYINSIQFNVCTIYLKFICFISLSNIIDLVVDQFSLNNCVFILLCINEWYIYVFSLWSTTECISWAQSS